MKPYYQDDSATLYQADSLAVLAELDTGSVDAIVTDPPYSSGGFTRSDRAVDVHTKYVSSEQNSHGTGGGALAAFSGDNRDQRGYAYWCALWLSECLRIAKDGGVVAVFTDWRQLPVTTDSIQAGGFVWRGIVPWHKPSGRPTQGRFSNTCEYVAWGSKGPRELLALDGAALPGFYQANAPRNRDHMTQKPLDVMRSLVKIAPDGGTILDPFMGSGTTGVAAILDGYRFIGIEQSSHYCEIAERRIREAQGQAVSKGDQLAIGDEPTPHPVEGMAHG